MYVHSSRIKKQIEHMQAKGVDVSPVYSLTSLTPEEINDHEKTFSFEQFQTILQYALDQTQDEYYGLYMGQEPHIAGTIGMMCASCQNLKDAFIQGCKFFSIQGNFADITFIEDKHYPKIEYTLNNEWLVKYPETARHEVEAMFSFLTLIVRINSYESIKPYRINLAYPAPSDNNPYEKLWGILPHFSQVKNEIILRESDLCIPMKAFNPETFHLLKNHIESQLKRFNNQESIKEKVKSVLLSSIQYQFPGIQTVASKLNTSARTLQRQLSQEKTTYKNILQETRFELAKDLLKQNDLTISEISYTLGYSDLGNFSRSFKRYTGESPNEYRSQ